MKKTFFQKRIPTALALFILLVGLGVTSVLIQKGVFTVSRASPDQEPHNLQVVNITDTSFAVSFSTVNPTVSGVNVVSTNPPVLVFDDRDSADKKPYVSHLITVKNLKPRTTYSFSVLSNGTTYLQNNKDFTVTTADTLQEDANTQTLSGVVLLPDGNPGNDTLIMLSIQNGAPVATITNDKGEYTFSSHILRDSSHNAQLFMAPKTAIELTASRGALTSKITAQYDETQQIPLITLSNDYSFISSEEETATDSSSLLVLPTGLKTTEIKITTPKQNQTFVDQKPQFKGTARPNTLVKITINSQTITATVRSDPNGNWAYRPSVALDPGLHTISIETLNAQGLLQKITSSFMVFASGSQVAESATPSATPTVLLTATPTSTPPPSPTVTPSPVPNASVTPVPTATPTITPSETPTPTFIAIASPTPIRSVPPKAVQATGSTGATILLTTVSLLFIVSGSVLLFTL